MNIEGIGTDIVDLRRIQRILNRFPIRFPQRVLHREEWQEYQVSPNRCGFLARRFAAKEAVAKALGMGFRQSVYTRNIHIHHDAAGCPTVKFYGDCAQRYQDTKILLSIADEIDYAVAYAIALSRISPREKGDNSFHR